MDIEHFTYSFPIECDDFEDLAELEMISPTNFKRTLKQFGGKDLLSYYGVLTIEFITLLREVPEFSISDNRKKIAANISILEDEIISRMESNKSVAEYFDKRLISY